MAAARARALRPQDEISHYRIVAPLGAGGMGEVYLAQDQSLERNVALKILPPELVRSEERVRRFVLEAKSASSLSHPNIVTIYEIGQDTVRSPGGPESGPVQFISMELVSGKTLTTLIHEDKTDLRTLLGYLTQAAEGLSKAHAAGIVHRDLKPGNIMVSADGFAKVLDFGLAKLTEKREAGPDASSAPTMSADATGEGIVVGTVGYMSPEQVQGKTLDHRSDVFSFGCILYEAATRRKPFAAETGVETMHKILHEKPTPVEEVNDQVPAELRRLIRRCLAKNPDQRLQSMKDLAIELREVVDEYDTLSASASSGSGTSAALPTVAARRAPVLPWIVGAVVVGLGGAALGWWGLQRAGHGRSEPFQRMRMTALTSRGDVSNCALSPDGRYLAYLAGKAGQQSLRVRQVATGSDVEVLPSTGATMANLSYSPDGNYVFYTALQSADVGYFVLYRIPSLGGPPEQVALDVDSRAAFSPDGKQIAFWRGVPQERQSHLMLVDLAAGKERLLASVSSPRGPERSPAWLPDGTGIATSLFMPLRNQQSTITFFDPRTGRRRDFLTLGHMQISGVAALPGGGLVASGRDLKSSFASQLFLVSQREPRFTRITNDFNDYSSVSASSREGAIAAVRTTQLSNLWIADALGGAPRQITSITSPENSPVTTFDADSDRVVYSALRDQSVQIWAARADGGEVRSLTSGATWSTAPVAGPRVILFHRLQADGIHVWRMNRDGGGLRQLTSGAGERVLSISPDGRTAAVMGLDSTWTASLVSIASGQARPVPGAYVAQAFSRDGRRLLIAKLVEDESGLVGVSWKVVPVDGGAPLDSLRLPPQSTGAVWSPDERGMTFLNTADPGQNVYRVDFHGGHPVPVTSFTAGRIQGYQWSTDGKKLAVIRRLGDATNVWVMEADGTHPTQVTQFTSGDVFELHWLPDNRRLAVNAGTSSQDAVLVRDFQ